MKGLLTIACNTFLRQGKLFPTSFASFLVTKYVIFSQKTNVRLLSKIKSQHVELSYKSYKSFYFSQEAKGIKIHRKLMTSILKTFHHFNRSSADNKHRTRSYDLWRVTGNWSHALVTSACCHEIFVAVVSNFNTVFTFFDKNSPHRSRNSHAYLFFFYLPTRL